MRADTVATGAETPLPATSLWTWLRWHLVLAALASVALSAWVGYAISIPNPDAVLYLRAADLFAAGAWDEAAAIYKWPFYSILIGGVKYLTGLEALYAAQVVNTILTLAMTLTLMVLAARLTDGDRAVVTATALLVLLHAQLTEQRSAIVKEHGYLAFLVATVLFAVIDNERPSWRTKLALLASLVGATLFRIEGLYLALLVAGYYILVRLRTVTAKATTIIVFVILASALLPLVFRVWVDGTLQNLMSSDTVFGTTVFWSIILNRVQILEAHVLTYGRGLGWHAYASVSIGIALYQTLRALTPVYSFFGLFAFVPNRLVPYRAMLPLAWFTIGQAPLLFQFAFLNAMLEMRYALGFAVLAMLTTVFCAVASWRELLMLRPRAFIAFPSMVIAILTAWVIDLPRPAQQSPLRQAAEWVETNVPKGARVWTNEPRVAYFAGLSYAETGGISQIVRKPPTDFESRGEVDVVILASSGLAQVPPRPVEELTLRTSFTSATDVVFIYVSCVEMVACPLRR